jgi:hypothetical protein
VSPAHNPQASITRQEWNPAVPALGEVSEVEALRRV